MATRLPERQRLKRMGKWRARAASAAYVTDGLLSITAMPLPMDSAVEANISAVLADHLSTASESVGNVGTLTS